MRLHIGILTATTHLRSGVVLLELHAPELARTVQAGQFCMVRCSPPSMSDPLLRRPYYVHSVQRERGLCSLLVSVQGRGSDWLAHQSEGAELDLLGPLGHGWRIRPTTRNLFLLCEERSISSMTLLIQDALRQELAVTLLNIAPSLEESYPPALLPPEVEYHVITHEMSQLTQQVDRDNQVSGQSGSKRRKKKSFSSPQFDPPLIALLGDLLTWADAMCCSVSYETLHTLYQRFERLHSKHFAQATYSCPLVCGTGMCLACSIDTLTGQQLVCRDGPVFDMRVIAD